MGGGWSTTRSGRFTSWESDPVPIIQEAWWAPNKVFFSIFSLCTNIEFCLFDPLRILSCEHVNFIRRNRKIYQILYLNVERYKLNFRSYRVWGVVISVYEVSATGYVCRHRHSTYLLTWNTHRTGQYPWRIEDKNKCSMQRINYSITTHNFFKPQLTL